MARAGEFVDGVVLRPRALDESMLAKALKGEYGSTAAAGVRDMVAARAPEALSDSELRKLRREISKLTRDI
jgi:hypothetical protein